MAVNYGGMINPLEIYQYGLQGLREGQARGKQSRLASLYSQALTGPQEQRTGLLGQMAAIDPSAANDASTSLYKMDDNAKASLGQEAALFSAVPPDQKPQAYARLAQHAHSIGLNFIPMQYDPRYDENIAKLAQTFGTGANGPAELQTFAAMSAGLTPDEVAKARRINLGLDPRAAIVQPGQYDSSRGAFVSNPFYGGGQQPQTMPQSPVGGDPFATLPQGLQISSGLRSPEHNREVGGVPNSYHLTGQARDIVPRNAQEAAQVQQWAAANGMEVINEGDHLHVEPRGNAPHAMVGGAQAIPVQGLPPKQTEAPHTYAPLTSDEVRQAGLPPGTFAQRDTVTGELKFGPAAVQAVEKPMSAYQQQQMQVKAGKAKAALSGTVADLDRMGVAVRKVMNAPGLGRITGIMGALPNIPGTDAANAEADLEALKSQIAFAVLAKMRAMSPTGGALGNVSDAEGRRLEANLAALDKAQSADQMKARLQDILDYIQSSKSNLSDAYDEQYGAGTQQSSLQQPASDDIGALLSKYGVK